jgi:hypothetical protein
VEGLGLARMNVHVYFSVEKNEAGEPSILSVVCQDTDGRTIAEWADSPTLESVSLICHKKLPYRLRRWLELLPKIGAKPDAEK